jgi:hypothetical protein
VCVIGCTASPMVVFNSSSASCVSIFVSQNLCFPRIFFLQRTVRTSKTSISTSLTTTILGFLRFSNFSFFLRVAGTCVTLHFNHPHHFPQGIYIPLIHQASSIAVCCVMSIQNLSTFGTPLTSSSTLLFFIFPFFSLLDPFADTETDDFGSKNSNYIHILLTSLLCYCFLSWFFDIRQI